MADGRLRVTGVPPAGPGLARALARLVKNDSVVTSLDDAKLRALASMLPEGREVEVAPLGDLVGRFLTMLGEPTPRLCPRGQQLATIDLVCRELPGDSPFADSSRFRGTAELIMERLGELRDWDFTAEELRAAAEEAGPRLAAKLVSLAEIDESVRQVLEETNRQFSTDRVASCLGIPPEGKLPIKRVVIATGREERPLYEGWIRWILRFGIDVEVLVDEVPGADRLFAASHRTAKRLGTKAASSKEDDPWYSALFSERVAAACPKVEILSTPDPLSETEWAMRGCLTEMRDGAMPHRLGVFARDTETYAPLVQASAQRLGVPLSLNLRVPLLTNGFAALTLRCLEALAGNDVRALWSLAGSSYLRGANEELSELQVAAGEAFMAGDGQWASIASWAEGREQGFEWLRHLLAWREQATESRTTLGGWLHRFIELVGGTRMIDLAMTADAPTRERDKRAQSVLQRSISDYAYIYDRVRRPELGLTSFVRLAGSLWENEQMVVEGRPNGVRFVSSTSALTSYDTLFVLGMLEGSLPRRRTEDPILFDTEREELSRLVGRSVRLPDSRDRAAAERDEFVRVCASADRRLVLSYPQTDDSRDNVPAFYLDELQRACGERASRSTRRRSQIVPAQGECVSEADIVLRTALDGPRSYPEAPSLETDAAKEAVRPKFEEGVSPEELSRALTCPFQAVMRYRLRIMAPARRRLMRSLRDLPADARIAEADDPETARSRLGGAIDKFLRGLYAHLDGWELSMLRAAAERIGDEWIEREFRARELWNLEDGVTVSDVELGEHGLQNTFKIGGKVIKLTGRIPSITTTDEFTVLRFFDSSPPNLREIQDVPEDNEDAFLYGLYLMAQYHLARHSPMVEIDGMNGERVLAGFAPTVDGLARRPAEGLNVHRVADRPVVFFKNVKARLKQAVVVLEAADMEARPGRHCEFCTYGELCRVSSQFGEQTDPFEGEKR